MKDTKRIELKGLMKKWSHMSIYHVYSQNYDQKCQKWPFLYFLSDNSNNLVKVWANYLSTSERSYLFPSENTMDFCVLSDHYQDINP